MLKNIKPEIAYRLINHGPIVLITTIDKTGKPNVMTLAWLTVVNSEPPLIAIAMGEQAYSQKLIKKTKEFVINIPDKKLIKKVLYCGSHSGKNIDKFKNTGLTPIPSEKIIPPKIKECLAHIECKVINQYEFSDVTLFISKIVGADVEEKIFDECLKTEKIKTIHHLGGGWFAETGKRFKS
ncbi:MAG: flavin reductase family protein [Elusimicrobiota bacterium]